MAKRRRVKQMQKLLNRSRLTEADTIRFGCQIKRRVAKKHLRAGTTASTRKVQLLEEGLADARKGRLVQAKEDYTRYADEKR